MEPKPERRNDRRGMDAPHIRQRSTCSEDGHEHAAQSWHAYESYTGPLGTQTLTDIVGSHYGPGIESSEGNGWGQWHRADHEGIGMDRTVATGTGFAGQYPMRSQSCMSRSPRLQMTFYCFFITFHIPTGCIRARR